ncbi:MAG: CoA transferase [Deltaproteobacteria bacterium]|nr:CoA transferase [Deltaproteobacteria bacterium]
MAGALDGIRVVDLTVWFQGPVAAQHLADFGAEVIKVERPQGGDQGRGVRSIKALPVGDWNQYFLVINRNKKGLALDLKKPEAREILYRLVEKSDVFLTNLGAENLERWELSYEKLRSINPRLIYATNSGYGPFGGIDKPSFDMTVQALTGLMARLGEPGAPPIYLGMGSGDSIGGLLAALGILLALRHRRRTGRGQRIDASLYGAQLFLAAPSLAAFLATRSPRHSRQVSRKDVRNPLWNRYPTRDGWIFLCMPEGDTSWRRVREALDDPQLASDPRFESPALRREHAIALVESLDASLSRRTSAEWMERFRPLGIVASPIGNLRDAATDPQAWANDYFVETFCEEVQRKVQVRGLPVGLSKSPGSVRTLGPELGQDTELILTETLGYDWDEVEAFKAKGAIP